MAGSARARSGPRTCRPGSPPAASRPSWLLRPWHQMPRMPDRPGADAWLAVEAAAAGLAFGSLLEWASTALVGSFRPQYLADPYWRGVPWLRTDTSGFAAFIVAGICLLS